MLCIVEFYYNEFLNKVDTFIWGSLSYDEVMRSISECQKNSPTVAILKIKKK